MLKKFSKFLLLFLLILVVSSSSIKSLADEAETTLNTTDTIETTIEAESTDPEIHSGDLYLIGNNVVMDKYVDGNVFLIGNNIEITGTVNGNLFVLANKVNFNQSLVRYSIFACANSVYYNGGCGTSSDYGNLYVASSDFETTFNSYVTGDVKSISSSIILKSAIYRDVDLICDTVNFGEGEDIPIIYGNLNYTANHQSTIPENVIVGNGTVTYTPSYDITNLEAIAEILIEFGTCIVTTLAIYIILNKLTPNLIEKTYNNKFSIISLLKAFGIGLLTIFVVLIFILLLTGTMVGTNLGIILALLFMILYLIATPILAISITNVLKPALKIEKEAMFYLTLSLVSIVLYGITFIPYVGTLLEIIINIIAIGLIVNIFLPHKELTEEQKLLIEEAQNQEQLEKTENENKE